MFISNVVILFFLVQCCSIGDPDWKLVLCLFGAWTVAFLVIIKGVRSSGKASYFLALFPYVIIAILLVHACTLEGAGKGIIFFIKPQV